MTLFTLEKTKISESLKIGSVLKHTKSFKRYFFVVSLILLFFFLYFYSTAPIETLKKLLGISLISFILSFICFKLDYFFSIKIKNPVLKNKLANSLDNNYNIGEFLSYESALAVHKAIRYSKKHKFDEINSSILFYFLLKDNKLDFVFNRALIDIKNLKSLLKKDHIRNKFSNTFSLDFQNVISLSSKIAVDRKHERIMVLDLVSALAEENEVFKKILIDIKLKSNDIYDLCSWYESREERKRIRKYFWKVENLRRKGSIAKNWSSGYANMLRGFSRSYTNFVRVKKYPRIVGHQKEIREIERTLAEREINNVVLVGEQGSGKKSIIEQIAIRSDLGTSIPSINYHKFIELNLNGLLSNSDSQESALKRLDDIFKEVVAAGNIVLIINNLNYYIGEDKEFNIESVLSSYIDSPDFKLIVISDILSYRSNIENNSSLSPFFRKIEVSEISSQETLLVLEDLVTQLENKYRLFISFNALKEIISASDKYIQNVPFPEKAIDLLDETVISLSQNKEKMVLASHVDKVVSTKTKIPVGELEEKEQDVLLNLESLIHKRIINQDQAVQSVAASLRRARSGISGSKGPMGSFLFLGPTGVGKTETAKALADIYFGSEKYIIRLDMSEFQNLKDIDKLLGNEEIDGMLTVKVRENPFSLVLLDEIEKAHPDILNIFLQVLDEGYVNDGLGRKVSFNNTIIIATSNAGYKVILKSIEENLNWEGVKANLLNHIFDKSIFRPEFVNRFSSVVVFGPLSKKHLIKIAELMLNKVEKNLRDRDIEIKISQELKEKIVELGYNPIFGAREMKRVIQDNIEDSLAKDLISKKINGGDTISIDPDTFKIKKI